MEHKRGNSILLTVIGAATLLVALVGATFAYFSATASSETQNVDTGKLVVTTSLSEATNTNIKPTTWSSTLSNNDSNNDIAVFTFTVNTTGTDVRGAKYDIDLTKVYTPAASVNNGVANQGGTASDIIWKLFKGSDTTAIATGNYGESNGTIVTAQNITDGSGQEDTYKLYVYIEETGSNQDLLQGATVSAQLKADAYTPKN